MIYILGTQHSEDNSFRPLEPVRVVNRTELECASLPRVLLGTGCLGQDPVGIGEGGGALRTLRAPPCSSGRPEWLGRGVISQQESGNAAAACPPGPRCLTPPRVTTVWDRPLEVSTRLQSRAVRGAVPASIGHETQRRTRPTHYCWNELRGLSCG